MIYQTLASDDIIKTLWELLWQQDLNISCVSCSWGAVRQQLWPARLPYCFICDWAYLCVVHRDSLCEQWVRGHSSTLINNPPRCRSETLLPAIWSGFCVALCRSHLVSRALTLPLIDISVIYGTLLPWPSSNWRWERDLSPANSTGKTSEEAQTERGFRFLSVNIFSSLLRGEPLQQGFFLWTGPSATHHQPPHATFFPVIPKSKTEHRDDWRQSMDCGWLSFNYTAVSR